MCGVLCTHSNSKLNEDIDIGPFASLFIGFGGVSKKYERFLRIDFGTLELGARLVVWFWGSFSGEIILRWRIFSNFWSISGRSRIFLAHLQYYLGLFYLAEQPPNTPSLTYCAYSRKTVFPRNRIQLEERLIFALECTSTHWGPSLWSTNMFFGWFWFIWSGLWVCPD